MTTATRTAPRRPSLAQVLRSLRMSGSAARNAFLERLGDIIIGLEETIDAMEDALGMDATGKVEPNVPVTCQRIARRLYREVRLLRQWSAALLLIAPPHVLDMVDDHMGDVRRRAPNGRRLK